MNRHKKKRMNCNILLLGNVSSGKSSMVNVLSLELEAPTSAGKTDCKKKEYIFTKNDKNSNFHLPFEKLSITDTPGFDQDDVQNEEGKHVLNEFIQSVNSEPKIIMYLIDTSHPKFDKKNHCANLEIINDAICQHNNDGIYVDLFIVFNKLDINTLDINEKKNILKKELKINEDQFIGLSCHQIFLNFIKNNNIDIKIPKSFNLKEVKNMVKNAGYRYQKALKYGIKNESIIRGKHLKKEEDDDEDDESYMIPNDIYNKIQASVEGSCKKHNDLLFEKLESEFSFENFNNDEIIKVCKRIIKINENAPNLSKKLDVKFTEHIERVIDCQLFEYFTQNLNNKDIDDVIYTHISNNIDAFSFDALYKIFINIVDKNDKNYIETYDKDDIFIKTLLSFDEFYTKEFVQKLQTHANIPKQLIKFAKMGSYTVCDLLVMDQFKKINKKVLKKYLGDKSYEKFKYVINILNKNDTLGNIMKHSNDDRVQTFLSNCIEIDDDDDENYQEHIPHEDHDFVWDDHTVVPKTNKTNKPNEFA